MPKKTGTLAGELGLISLFDLGQLLLLNRASGVMSVTSDSRRGALWFRDGQLVNAIDDTQRDGEEAAYAVFGWRSGHFEFRGAPLTGPPTIENGTEAVMLEAARRIDEGDPDAGSSSAGSETAKLVEHQSRFDLLREEFSRVTKDAASAARHVPAAEDSWLEALETPSDRLLMRPGEPPRLHVRGAWRITDGFDLPMDDATYRAFKSRLLAAGSPAHSSILARKAIVRYHGRALAIEVVVGERECMWLSLAAPASTANVRGPFELVDALFAEPTLLMLAAAPDADAAHALLGALIARLSDICGITALVVSDDPMLAPPATTGVVIATTLETLEASATAARPNAIAVGARGVMDGRLLTAFSAVPIVLSAVIAADPESIVSRWLLRFPAAEVARARLLVESMPVAVALAHPAVTAGGPLGFTVHRATRASVATSRAQ